MEFSKIMNQQNDNFNDFVIERNQYKVVIFEARNFPVMDLYFRDNRTTTIRFENGINIIQNNKELTFTMDSIIKKALDFLKESYPENEIDILNVRKELRDNYDETRS